MSEEKRKSYKGSGITGASAGTVVPPFFPPFFPFFPGFGPYFPSFQAPPPPPPPPTPPPPPPPPPPVWNCRTYNASNGTCTYASYSFNACGDGDAGVLWTACNLNSPAPGCFQSGC